MSLYVVNHERCTRCGVCVRLCVTGIIQPDAEKRPFVAPENETHCIRCGQCVAFCPETCNSLSFQTGELPLVDASLFPSVESGETFLRSRRSVRHFKQQAVPRSSLDRIFETVRYAPTASNSQAVRWIVFETREKTDALEKRIIDVLRNNTEEFPPDGKLGGMAKFLVKQWDAGNPIIFRGAPQLVVAVLPVDKGMKEDGAIALTYLELAAHALGVGCCWGGFFTHAFQHSATLRKSIGIAEDEHVAGAQMMGYPVLGLSKRLPVRKSPDITWF